MTREGKCDVCRQRKVRCDESKPCCGPCQKKARQCTYHYATKRPFLAFVAGNTSESLSIKSMDSPIIGPPEMKHNNHIIRLANLDLPGTSLALSMTTSTQNPRGSIRMTRSPGSRDSRSKRNATRVRKSDQSSGTDLLSVLPLNRQPTDHATDLAFRWKSWGDCLCPGEPIPYLCGEYLEVIPQRVGVNRAFDLGLECAIVSTVAFANRTQENYIKAYELNAKALIVMRDAMALERASKRYRTDVLLTTFLLYFAESLLNTYNASGRIHHEGGTRLLMEMTKHGTECDDDVIKIFWACVGREFLPAVLTGTDSVFDTPAWLQYSIPPFAHPNYPQPEFVDRYNKERYIRLPRLIRLIRELRHASHDHNLRKDVLALAKDLYQENLEDWVEQLFVLGLIWWKPTSGSAPSDASSRICHTAQLGFASSRIFMRFTAYYELRCLICGCILTLCDLSADSRSPLISGFDASAVAEQDTYAARQIAACEEWALEDASPLRFRVMWLFMPVLYALGSWQRLILRANNNGQQQQQQQQQQEKLAHGMEQWSLNFIRAFEGRWGGRPWTPATIKHFHRVLIGGDL